MAHYIVTQSGPLQGCKVELKGPKLNRDGWGWFQLLATPQSGPWVAGEMVPLAWSGPDAPKRVAKLLESGRLFARKCDHCGRGMNEGYLIEGTGETYCDKEECREAVHALITEAGYTGDGWEDEWEEAYEDDYVYWTAWEDEVCFLQVGESETDLVEVIQ